MSGICGLVYPEGRTVEHREIEAVLKPLERRGPDGSHVVMDCTVAFGHASLATTPEAVIETLPLSHAPSGCTITADARLDYPEELAERLGVTNNGDGELILLAYLKWGYACLDHLRGDFAFAVHDPRDGTVFCARDQVGMRQLIWHHQPGRLFAFATEAQALLEHPDVPCEVNEARVGDFFEDLEAHDLSSTFFVGLNKLPPAHAIFVRDGEIRQWRYWQALPQALLRRPDDQSYAEAFLDVFTGAVRTRLRCSGPVGSMLSGGMDSGSVVAVAAQLLNQRGDTPLRTYSALQYDPDCIESKAIRAAMQIDHIEPAQVRLEELDAYIGDLVRLTRESGEPFDIHMALPRAVYLAAHRAGAKVMLDGVGGDTTLGSEPMVEWYLKRGRLLAALREARGEQRFWREDADRWADHARSLVRAIAPKGWIAARQARYREHKLSEAAVVSPLKPEFAARIDMPGRRREHADYVAPGADFQSRQIERALHPHVVVARERYDRTAAALAIEPRDPFLDLRVIEFCQTLPQSQLQHDGWPKIILRRAMSGLLPDAVRWRRGKEHLGYHLVEALAEGAQAGLTSHKTEHVNDFVSLQCIASRQKGDQSAKRIDELTKFGYLEGWLKHVNACN